MLEEKFYEGVMDSDFLGNLWVQISGLIGLLAVSSRFIRKRTKDVDNDFSPEVKESLTLHLKALSERNAAWMFNFQFLFVIFFGEKHLSWRCFLRSISITSISFVLVGLATGPFVVDVEQYSQLIYGSSVLAWLAWLIVLALFGIVYNGSLDYISLWKTRLIIKSSLQLPNKIILDLMITILVVLFLLNAAIMLTYYYGTQFTLHYTLELDVPDLMIIGFLAMQSFSDEFAGFPPEVGTIGFVIFFTSFLPTLWFILHVLGGVMLEYTPRLVSILNIEEKPMRAIGVVAIFLIWLLGLPLGLIVIGIT